MKIKNVQDMKDESDSKNKQNESSNRVLTDESISQNRENYFLEIVDSLTMLFYDDLSIAFSPNGKYFSIYSNQTLRVFKIRNRNL